MVITGIGSMKLVDKSKLANRRVAGYFAAVVGFLMLVSNALGYLLDWPRDHTPFLIIGLVLVVTGINLAKSK